MKKTRKTVAILVCLIMVASMAVVASAAVSAPLFIKKSGAYQCQGSANIGGTTATASLHAEALPMQQILPDSDCVSKVSIKAYDKYGDVIGEVTNTGDVDVITEYAHAPSMIGKIECSFRFNGADLGEYTLYAK